MIGFFLYGFNTILKFIHSILKNLFDYFYRYKTFSQTVESFLARYRALQEIISCLLSPSSPRARSPSVLFIISSRSFNRHSTHFYEFFDLYFYAFLDLMDIFYSLMLSLIFYLKGMCIHLNTLFLLYFNISILEFFFCTAVISKFLKYKSSFFYIYDYIYAIIIILLGGNGRLKFVKDFLHCSREHVIKMKGLIDSLNNLDLGSSNGFGGPNGPKGPNPNCNNNSSNTGVPHGDDSNESNLQEDSNNSTDHLDPSRTPEAVEDSNDSFDSADLRVEGTISRDRGTFQPLHGGPEVPISRVNMSEDSLFSNLMSSGSISLENLHNLALPSTSEFSRFIDTINLGFFNPEEMQVEGLSSLEDHVFESSHGVSTATAVDLPVDLHEVSNINMDTSSDSLPPLEELSSLEAPPTNITSVLSSSDSLPSLEELPISRSPTSSPLHYMEE